MTGNWIATLAFVAWPFVSAYLYSHRTRSEATIWTILGALLILPDGTSIKFAMIPAFDKNSIPNLCAFVGCLLAASRAKPRPFQFGICEVLLIVFVISPLVTSLLNGDPILIGGTILPGVDSYDGTSTLIGQFIFILSFYVGRKYLGNPGDIETILRALIVSGLVYSLPMLFEIRMSPQLSMLLYGYMPSFGTEFRYGGFRPVVFMGNGLIVAFFMMTCVVAAAAYWRIQKRVVSVKPSIVTSYLSGILLLCKSAGALIYGIAMGGLVRFASPRTQMRVAVVLAFLALFYPILRATDLFPNGFLVDLATSFDEERAQSLGFRFDQEAALLNHASDRFYFGWGRFGRSRIITEESGKDDSVTDGRWIITMGQFGFVGFLAEFGLLVLPIFRAFRAMRFLQNPREQIFLAALTLILAISVVDLLPNASLSSWTLLLAGSLLGQSETLQSSAQRQKIPSGLKSAVA
jgi:hypothetical protein